MREAERLGKKDTALKIIKLDFALINLKICQIEWTLNINYTKHGNILYDLKSWGMEPCFNDQYYNTTERLCTNIGINFIQKIMHIKTSWVKIVFNYIGVNFILQKKKEKLF